VAPKPKKSAREEKFAILTGADEADANSAAMLSGCPAIDPMLSCHPDIRSQSNNAKVIWMKPVTGLRDPFGKCQDDAQARVSEYE
jgi:hypothetical protein